MARCSFTYIHVNVKTIQLAQKANMKRPTPLLHFTSSSQDTFLSIEKNATSLSIHTNNDVIVNSRSRLHQDVQIHTNSFTTCIRLFVLLNKTTLTCVLEEESICYSIISSFEFKHQCRTQNCEAQYVIEHWLKAWSITVLDDFTSLWLTWVGYAKYSKVVRAAIRIPCCHIKSIKLNFNCLSNT